MFLLRWVPVLLILSGCKTFVPPKPNDPLYAPRYQSYEAPKKVNNGSLYQTNGTMFLYEDKKASQVGDIITITLTESTNASKQADTELKKDTDLTMANPTIAGTQVTFDHGSKSFQLGLDSQNQFKGEADSSQSNQLNGTITVTVQEIMPNGNLFVRGEKWITLNKGDEFIRVSGIIRPNDIDSSNTVASTRLANARIEYSGTGPLAETNDVGWLTRFFNSGWWPF
ncbi:flagellar basal body L-ring protein FlgH [Pleionea sp. CnH1-48]|uniref:flagellar basal body L-ring protein FlgH n=1 Tax=Pleionea sp. CnH1-48 TaxID=2954494 RepID=UPI00209794FD|nr:flagellar basal body L-ring protein FlgH [Pleionea sp. CnH1-48]MCO7226155.1 flagellar basal body L-ring protein FlgH [Pleionea sp. CnH1-48]